MEQQIETILRLHNVSKSFGDTQVLSHVNFEVAKGETLAVIGQSGCGKTTLLRCVNMLDSISEGEIFFDGKVVCRAEKGSEIQFAVDPDTYRTQVGMVFQALNIWPHLSVVENLMLAPRAVKDISKRQTMERATALLEKVGIKDKLHDYPDVLSRGQQQRVAIARALMMEPKLLLLDEITSALDPEIVGEILDIICELKSTGTTMVIVTHEMHFALEVAQKVIFIDESKIVEWGRPSDVILNPQTQRLQKFLERIKKHRIS